MKKLTETNLLKPGLQDKMIKSGKGGKEGLLKLECKLRTKTARLTIIDLINNLEAARNGKTLKLNIGDGVKFEIIAMTRREND